MKKSKKIVALLTLSLMLLQTVTAFATDGDVWRVSSQEKVASSKELLISPAMKTLHKEAVLFPARFSYEKGGKLYKLTDLNDAFRKDKKNYLNNLESNYVGEAVPMGDLKVLSVSAINAKTLEVKFSNKVKKAVAETAAKYTVKNTKTNAANTVTAAALKEDAKTVLLTLTDPLDGNYVVSIEPIDAAEGTNKTELYTQTISVEADTVRPVLKQVLYPAAGVAELVFSEQLSKPGTVTVTPAAVTPVVTKLMKDKIVLSELESEKEYTVTVLAAEDMAGNLVSPNPLVVKVQNNLSDTEKPVVESVKTVGLKTVVIKFSEPLKDKGTGKFAVVAVDSADKVSDAESFDAEKLELTYTVNLGLVAAEGAHTLEVKEFHDLAGNAGVSKKFNLQFENKVMMEKVEVSEDHKKVTITFTDEPTDSGSTLALTRLDSDGITTTVTVEDAQINAVGKTLKLTQPLGAVFEKGSYTATLTKALVTNLKEESTPISFEVGDSEQPAEEPTPTLGAITAQTVRVTYDQDMGASAKDPANYTVEGNKVFEKAIFDTNLKTVVLTLKKESIAADAKYTFEISTKVAGKDGKAIKPFSKVADFKENIAPVIKKTVLEVHTKKITVDFSEEVTYAGTDYVEVYINGVKVALNTPANPPTDLTAGAKQSVITLKDEIADITKPIKLKFVKELKDANNNILDMSKEYVVTP